VTEPARPAEFDFPISWSGPDGIGERSYWGGDHSLFLGRVGYARQNPGTPLLLHGGRYERLGQPG
jgi:hypothetical protein